MDFFLKRFYKFTLNANTNYTGTNIIQTGIQNENPIINRQN